MNEATEDTGQVEFHFGCVKMSTNTYAIPIARMLSSGK